MREFRRSETMMEWVDVSQFWWVVSSYPIAE
jgi:hypothetical protein